MGDVEPPNVFSGERRRKGLLAKGSSLAHYVRLSVVACAADTGAICRRRLTASDRFTARGASPGLMVFLCLN